MIFQRQSRELFRGRYAGIPHRLCPCASHRCRDWYQLPTRLDCNMVSWDRVARDWHRAGIERRATIEIDNNSRHLGICNAVITELDTCAIKVYRVAPFPPSIVPNHPRETGAGSHEDERCIKLPLTDPNQNHKEKSQGGQAGQQRHERRNEHIPYQKLDDDRTVGLSGYIDVILRIRFQLKLVDSDFPRELKH